MQDAEGRRRDLWGSCPIRVTDLTITPDLTRLVAIGMYVPPVPASGPPDGAPGRSENRIIIFDMATRMPEASVICPKLSPSNSSIGFRSVSLSGEVTSVKISQDSRFALINRAPDEESPCVRW